MTHLDRIHEIQKSLQSWIKEDSHKRTCVVKDAETSVYVPSDHIATLLKAFNIMREIAARHYHVPHVCSSQTFGYTLLPTQPLEELEKIVDEEFEERMEPQ